MEKPTPIAIIGMSFRGPGGADNPEKLWDLLHEGRNAWTQVPMDRWNEDAHYHPEVSAKGSNNHKGGHFMNADPAQFDASFFNIPDAEAYALDPQQRLMLEVAYEAFENAGVTIEELKGSKTSVYTATFVRDYELAFFNDSQTIPVGVNLCVMLHQLILLQPYTMTGIGTAIIANRISYNFDLRGESYVLDTGCSGTLVALHQACQNLRAGDSNMALVGGTNLLLSPLYMSGMSLSR